MNLKKQFYQVMTNSKVALPEVEIRVTEMENGIIVSKPLKKIEHISAAKPTKAAQVWNLTRNGPVLESKAAPVRGINKLKAIQDFINSNGRV